MCEGRKIEWFRSEKVERNASNLSTTVNNLKSFCVEGGMVSPTFLRGLRFRAFPQKMDADSEPFAVRI
jgi:hypothetical protein